MHVAFWCCCHKKTLLAVEKKQSHDDNNNTSDQFSGNLMKRIAFYCVYNEKKIILQHPSYLFSHLQSFIVGGAEMNRVFLRPITQEGPYLLDWKSSWSYQDLD